MKAPSEHPSARDQRFDAVQRAAFTAGLGLAASLLGGSVAWRPSSTAEWALMGGACLFGFIVGSILRSLLGVLTWPVIAFVVLRFVASGEADGGLNTMFDGLDILLCGLLSTFFGVIGVFVATPRSRRKP